MDCSGYEYDPEAARVEYANATYFLNGMKKYSKVNLSLTDLPQSISIKSEVIESALISYCDEIKNKMIDGGYRVNCSEFFALKKIRETLDASLDFTIGGVNNAQMYGKFIFRLYS
jgi:hypothetical protein